MALDMRETWTVLHGLIFGAVFLLAFAGGFAGLYSLRPEWVTVSGMRERLFRLKLGTWVMAIVAWITVVSGTYIVYPWYRAKPPEGTADLTQYPRSFLKADPNLAAWHTFGMEWKEHIAWLSPILAVAVAYVVTVYGGRLAHMPGVRRTVLVLFTVAFIAAGIAGLVGAFLNKVAPVS